MLPVTNIPRPTLASVLAEVVEAEVLLWISHSEKRIGTDAYKAFIATLPEPDQFIRLLHSAAARRDTPDAFAICEDLKSVLDWPVDGELAAIFVEGIRETKTRALRTKTIEWVMKTGRRFNHKGGDEVVYHDKSMDTHRKGKVISVDRPTASATIEYGPDDSRAHKVILAEELVA